MGRKERAVMIKKSKTGLWILTLLRNLLNYTQYVVVLLKMNLLYLEISSTNNLAGLTTNPQKKKGRGYVF